MKKELVKVGKIGRPHGLRGELEISIEDHYFEDVVQQDSLLVAVGSQYVPYFVEAWRSGGNLVKLEEVDDKESAQLLQQRALYLSAEQVTIKEEDIPVDNPYAGYVNFTIKAEDYGTIGTITTIVDLPDHYLAEIAMDTKNIMIPLHHDLIVKIDEGKKTIEMRLPEGLLEL